ncbi:hypothetical protein A9Q99_18510 [Gammaproteobacteria bacterium 45_16_T64]|nr:hypothetical protein A9Q99_18510 [Gammaproteobacteria bacterium 45_16_T64]
MKLLVLVAFVFVMSGCSRNLYDWGGYNDHLYDYYSDPSTADAFLISLEKHLAKIESAQGTPAPGLYAEVGTLYLQKGDEYQATQFYQKEHDAWPESRYFMATLIKSLNKRKDTE